MAKRKKGKTVKMTTPENYIRQRARTLPIDKCLINSDWEENGLASIMVVRKHTNGNFTVGLYLVDLRCLGVKDAHYYFNLYPSEFKELLEHREESADMVEVPYVLVHNIVYAGVEFAEDYGFRPHKDFSVAQYILEEDTDDIELMEINCGYNGKPLYMRGPLDSEVTVSRIISQLEKTAGTGNYVFIDKLQDEEWEDDLDDEEEDDSFYEDFVDDDFSDDELWDEFKDDSSAIKPIFNEKDIQNSTTFQFKIQLKEISKPPVWRRITVPSYYSFLHFHYIIQMVFGWTNSHLYQFSENGFDSRNVITTVYEDLESWNDLQMEAKEVPLSEIFTVENQKYVYIYDFGDSWEHQIVLEKIVPEITQMPRLLDGKGACPPEDCGGVYGYENLKNVVADKSHPEHRQLKQWLGLGRGETWDPAAFDIEEIQDLLESVFTP